MTLNRSLLRKRELRHNQQETKVMAENNLFKERKELTSIVLAQEVSRALVNQKALDVLILGLEGVSDVADYFVLSSATSDRHLRGLADKVYEALLMHNEKPLSWSGRESGDWALLDYADVVVHIFYEPTRQFYDLENLWLEAKRIPLPKDIEDAARHLRTGMLAKGKNSSS